MELAHAHPMAGHLGTANTIQRLRDRFHWPGLDGDVKSFCQACPTCQRTAPRMPPPSPLIPLPIIEVPFERIGMDLVGPLPKSARGHEHILVVVDYATRYPEAIPLRKATAKNIAQELFLLCTRVGIPTEILTDQGTPFMSRLMADLCRLLRVKQLRTTVYHPQTDGLVERFNQTLKQMLKRVAAEDRKDWDLLIPYVLFGIREVPQASTGFTPFELLFGRQPRGLLDVAKEAWEQQQPAPLRSTIEHVREMRERIERVMPLVKEHLTKAQQSQQRRYNRAAQPREFHPGDRVMVLVPTSACKFLATWQGPYTVTERIGPVTYRLRQPGKRREEQLYHINLLKRWVGTREQLAALAVTDPVVVDMGEELSAAQRTELQHLVSQFSDVFSTARGTPSSSMISTPTGVICQAAPYRVPEVVDAIGMRSRDAEVRNNRASRSAGPAHRNGTQADGTYVFGTGKRPSLQPPRGTATFQRMMDVLLAPPSYAAAYLDTSSTLGDLEEHPGRLRRDQDPGTGFLGAVLSQTQGGEEHPVVNISRKLTTAESKYATVEKEALAIKWAVLELRYYLLGRRFTLLTDHAPLQWMSRAKDTNARVTRWFLALQDFNFTVKHRAGVDNANADGLSRLWSAFAGEVSGVPPGLQGAMGVCSEWGRPRAGGLMVMSDTCTTHRSRVPRRSSGRIRGGVFLPVFTISGNRWSEHTFYSEPFFCSSQKSTFTMPYHLHGDFQNSKPLLPY
ncbi:hypothetical protein QQF64_006313 [Cirrhinus molitorella]|uniref:Gypsy retrotransposon integrase-like protein 1 n=1 Tax=Cirrhinus molitorella TaxID=172907 RepID=A0ABR3MHW4_9TELE